MSKNMFMLSTDESAKSAGEAQYKYPNRDAGTDAFAAIVSRSLLLA